MYTVIKQNIPIKIFRIGFYFDEDIIKFSEICVDMAAFYLASLSASIACPFKKLINSHFILHRKIQYRTTNHGNFIEKINYFP